MPPNLPSLVPALVGQYLHQIGSCVAFPFILEFQPREVDFCLEEVVRSYREESRVMVHTVQVALYFRGLLSIRGRLVRVPSKRSL